MTLLLVSPSMKNVSGKCFGTSDIDSVSPLFCPAFNFRTFVFSVISSFLNKKVSPCLRQIGIGLIAQKKAKTGRILSNSLTSCLLSMKSAFQCLLAQKKVFGHTFCKKALIIFFDNDLALEMTDQESV